MSIATDEALEWHGLHGDEPGDRDSTYSAEELDAAYIAGRTADVTDAQIAAARTSVCASLLEGYQPRHTIVNGLTVKIIQPDPCIVTFNDGTRMHVDRLVRLVLDTARKAAVAA